MGLIRTLRDTEPFRRLPDEIYAEIDRAAQLRKFPPRTHLFHQHDPPTGFVYLIRKGHVEIVALTPGGVEMIVDERREGSFFGATPIFTNDAYTAGARTVTATECYLIPRDAILRAARLDPRITEHFTHDILSRLRKLYSEMLQDYSREALAQPEAYPFKKRLSEVMYSPAETCTPETSIREVARRMTQREVGAVVVTSGDGGAAGIITERDIVSKILAREGGSCRTSSAADVMTPHPFTLGPGNYVYEATALMIRSGVKHLPVLDKGRVAGMVTLGHLMDDRSRRSMLLVESVRRARTIEELAAAKSQMVNVAKALMSEARSHFETVRILSFIHEAILRRGFDLVLDQMKGEGTSPPAVRFCLIVMGSGGRKEMLLGPDQDNGFLYEDVPDERLEEVEAFFAPFSRRLVKAYEQIGYPLCRGGVMADNPLWRGRLRDWQERVATWINIPEPKRVMYSTIFLDFMPLVGDPTLCQDLRKFLHGQIRSKPVFLFHLLENELSHKPPLGLLGNFVVEKEGPHKGELSLKQAGSVFIVDCVRMFLLEQGMDATTTLERLEKLVALNVFNRQTADHIKAALEAFIFLRLRHEIELIEEGRPPSHFIAPASLSRNEQDLLQEAFRAAGRLQDSTKRHFGRGIRG